MPTRSDVVSRWPALNAVVDAREWEMAFLDAAARITDGIWGAQAELGRIHYAGHLIAIANPTVQTPGPISSESAGGVSVSYAVKPASTDPDDLRATPQGRAYLRLRRSLGLIGSAV